MEKTGTTMSTIEVISYSLEGNSFPIVVKKHGEKFLVKLRAGLSGEYALLSEWFGNTVGDLIGLTTQRPHWIWLDENVVSNDIHIEVRELINKSAGVNIGFRYIENAQTVEPKDLEEIGDGNFTDAFLFDVLMLNIDRTRANPNVLKDRNSLFLSDYESSLLLSQIIEERDYLSNVRILECLRRNLFYQQVQPSEIESFLARLNTISFDMLLASIPNKVLAEAKKAKLLKGLEKKRSESWRLEETLHKLGKVVLESDEVRVQRIKRNRERFERLMKRT